MGGIVFIFFIIFIIVIVVGITQSQKAGEAWSATARTLGMEYSGGGMFQKRSLSGVLHGNHAFVDTFTRGSGKSSTTYTRYRIHYPHPLGLGLKITQEGFFTGVSKALGAQDIQIGDAGFDQAALIKGNDPKAVTEFLTLARRSRIHRALNSFSRLRIEDEQIYWEHRGVQRSQAKLSESLRKLSLLAWFLCGDREEDQPLQLAAQARQAGRLDEAIKAVRQVPAVHGVPPIEAKVMEAQILHLGNRHEEATNVLAEAGEHAPDDEEVKEWTALQQNPPKPPPLPGPEPPAAPAAPQPLPDPTPQSPEPARQIPEPLPPATEPTPQAEAPEEPPVVDSGLSAEETCSDLFKAGASSADIERTFASTYLGQRVTWQGTLKSCQSTSFDFVFGNQPCTKTTLDLLEVEGGSFGRKSVQAIVQLPPEAKDTLEGKTGEKISFSGELLKVDGLMRNVFVRNATLV